MATKRTKPTSYLATYRSPPACYVVAPVRRINPEDRAKDNATTFRLETRAVNDALHAQRIADRKNKKDS